MGHGVVRRRAPRAAQGGQSGRRGESAEFDAPNFSHDLYAVSGFLSSLPAFDIEQ